MAGLFDRLREAAGEEWTRYTRHEFVRRLGDGSLEQAAFRHYLIQDYLFLIHFARAYALAVYKSDTLADMRQAGASLSAILDLEMGLHVKFCAGWGLDEDAMAAAPEATGTLAYTRFVLERGMAGDLLDLHVALAPCIVGYAEIAAELMADPATKLEGNPYREWIEMYAGEEYRAGGGGGDRPARQPVRPARRRSPVRRSGEDLHHGEPAGSGLLGDGAEAVAVMPA